MDDRVEMTREVVRAVMTGESPGLARTRRFFRMMPSSARCKLCAAPFRGLAGLAVRPAGYGRSPGNPALCMKCAIVLRRVGNDTAARLASAAGAGELIVSAAAVEAAGTDADGLERRTVEIRGRTQPIEVLVLRPAAS